MKSVFNLQRRVKKPGFGLIEVLIASLILSVVITAGLALGVASSKSVSGVKQRLTATGLAQGILEKTIAVRQQYWTDNNPATNFTDLASINPAIAVPATPTKVDNIQYNQQLMIKADLDNPRIKEVTATVSWQERGISKQVKLSTILTDWRWE